MLSLLPLDIIVLAAMGLLDEADRRHYSHRVSYINLLRLLRLVGWAAGCLYSVPCCAWAGWLLGVCRLW